MFKSKPNEFIDNGNGTISIRISTKKFGDQFCVVDSEDFNRIKCHRWSVKPCGSDLYYLHTSIGNRRTGFSSTITMHRLVMSFPDGVIDHINGNCFDNRKCNLRVVTSSENRRNSTKQRNTKCKYRGVYERSSSPGFFRAQLRIKNKIKNIGTFKSAEEAARAYDAEAIKQFGVFATLNFPICKEKESVLH